MGAALAYYTAFSLAPLLVIAIGIAGLVFGEEAARGEIQAQIRDTIGESASQATEDMIKNSSEQGGGIVATLISLAILLVGASGLFIELQSALNEIWEVPPEKQGSGILAFIKDRLLSFGLVVGTGFLLLVSLIVSAALSALGRYLTPESMPGGALLWQAINLAVSFALITLMFAMIFKILPETEVQWRDVWIGAAFTAVLFTVGKYLIGLYLAHSSTASSYGAAGSLVVILIWVYYSAQILLFGAEFTHLYARRFGGSRSSAPGKKEPRELAGAARP
jgi:membrane protein